MAAEADHLPLAPARPNRRALILPGGGMRVAYQAGAIKALFDQGLRFSIADGASGGTMNLAALLCGATPDQLCARWRSLNVMRFVSLRPLSAYLKFPATGALGGFDGIESSVFPHLGIDASQVRQAKGISATFNVCDFEDKRVVAVPHTEVSRELLLAGISLPIATPAVQYQGRMWTDAVWIRDSNLMATVRAGANELWVIWCIANTPKFKDSLLGQYVHMIEMSALGKLHEELDAIADINQRIAKGEKPFGHDKPIVVHLIKPAMPIPLDPDFLVGKVDAATLIAYGHADAARYLAAMKPNGVSLTSAATKMIEPGQGISFREVMTGRICFGEIDPEKGSANLAAYPVSLRGTIDIRDLRSFAQNPQHQGELAGHLEIHRLGGWFPSTGGRFGLFSPSGDPQLSYMTYEMGVRVADKAYWLKGRKHVRVAGPWKAWAATTTLYVTLHEGIDDTGPIAAAGILRLGAPELMALLGTLHATGCERWPDKIKSIWQFARFFAGALYQTYIAGRPLS